MRRALVGLACVPWVLACSVPEGGERPAAEASCPRAAEPPRSVGEVVQALNAMPKPVELPCLLQALPRPLPIYATMSSLSLQPAFNRESPRIFIFADPLILSVVPDGDGQHLLEMGEQREAGRSIKAELAFPVETEVTPAMPFEHVMFSENTTTCGFCHGGETLVESSFTGIYESQALRPLPNQKVSLEEVALAAANCDASAQPARCAVLKAIFGHGEVVHREFPASFGMFF
jgi:hypothetical protein